MRPVSVSRLGLADAIRTDNGAPFASTGIHGLSQLNVWWMQLGIVHQRISPSSPQQNGTHERMHRELKRKALRYEQLGEVTRKEAAEALAQRLAVAATGVPRRSRVTFRTIATEWESHVVPMYKPSTQKNHRHVR